MTPEFLSVGFITRDFIENREQPGGSALYSAKCAQKLGVQSAIWTSAENHYPKPSDIEGIEVARTPSPVTTTFTHIYKPDGSRGHRCDPIAPVLLQSTLPAPWVNSRLVLLCPNWNEVTPETFELFPTRWMAFAPQGWFRNRSENREVFWSTSKWNKVPRKIELLVVSQDDLQGDPEAWNWVKELATVAVCTYGQKGHLVRFSNREIFLEPPFVAQDIDPTGAGDVFTTAMLISMEAGMSPLDAAQIGSVAASYAVEARSFEGMPTREQIEKRLGSKA